AVADSSSSLRERLSDEVRHSSYRNAPRRLCNRFRPTTTSSLFCGHAWRSPIRRYAWDCENASAEWKGHTRGEFAAAREREHIVGLCHHRRDGARTFRLQ